MAFDTVAADRPAPHPHLTTGLDLDLAVMQAQSTARVICRDMRNALATGDADGVLEDHASAGFGLHQSLQRTARDARAIGQDEAADTLERWAALADVMADCAIGSSDGRRQALALAELLADVVRLPLVRDEQER